MSKKRMSDKEMQELESLLTDFRNFAIEYYKADIPLLAISGYKLLKSGNGIPGPMLKIVVNHKNEEE